MNIVILGGGRMGQTLARLLIGAGHRVWLANSLGCSRSQRNVLFIAGNDPDAKR